MKRLVPAGVICACLTLLVAGCGEGGVGTTYPAGGTLKFEDGTAVANATVTFNPVKLVEGQAVPTAMTDQNGNFKLKTGEQDGAPAGEYKVTVSVTDAGAVGPDVGKIADPGKGGTPKGESPKTGGPTVSVAEEYMLAEKTPLTVTIKADGDNTKIELKVKKGPAGP